VFAERATINYFEEGEHRFYSFDWAHGRACRLKSTLEDEIKGEMLQLRFTGLLAYLYRYNSYDSESDFEKTFRYTLYSDCSTYL